MNERPYLIDRRCGRCLVPLETVESREGGWLIVTYICPTCGPVSTVTFSPQELAEWARRRSRAAGQNSIEGRTA